MNGRREHEIKPGTEALRPADIKPLWSALLNDTDACVAVLDGSGRILYVNDGATRHYGLDAAAITGRTLADCFPHEWAEERLELLHRVLETGKPIRVLGMCVGAWSQATYRAMPSEKGVRGRVLAVCRPIVRGAPPTHDDGVELVQARVHDMGPLASLTRRELDILRLIGQGLSTSEIAERLNRSAKTIEWHRVALGAKLGGANRVELARIAIRAGLSEVDTAITG